MVVTAETLRLQRQIRTFITETTNQQTRDLTRAWVLAWDVIEPELTKTLRQLLVTSGDRISAAQMLRSTQLLATLRLIADQLEQLAADANVRIIGDLRGIVEAAGGAQASVIDSQLPTSAAGRLTGWGRVDPRQIEAIVRRTTTSITSRMAPLSPQTLAVVRRELIRGVAVGANPKVTAARMVAGVEQRLNGEFGLTRALRISRTESLDAHRAGAQLGRMQNADVLAGWIWWCELGPTSCPACIAMHGTVFPAEDPGPFDHPNGRCDSVPLTRSWADLGFDELEPDVGYETGPEWFANQDEPTQRQILGPSRLAAYQAGHYPPAAWAETRHNDGWRDSVQVTRTPQRSVALAS